MTKLLKYNKKIIASSLKPHVKLYCEKMKNTSSNSYKTIFSTLK